MADFNSSSAAVCPQVFYLFTMVVLTIVVASVLEAFRFRIQYKRSTTKRDGEHPPALAPSDGDAVQRANTMWCRASPLPTAVLTRIRTIFIVYTLE